MNSQITPSPPPSGIWGTAAAAWLALDPMTKSAVTSVLLVGASWLTAWGPDTCSRRASRPSSTA